MRLIIYYYYEKERELYVAQKWAITPEEYSTRMFQAGFASVAAFAGSIVGVAIAGICGIGVTIPSLAVGFIWYLASRWLGRIVYEKAKAIL